MTIRPRRRRAGSPEPQPFKYDPSPMYACTTRKNKDGFDEFVPSGYDPKYCSCPKTDDDGWAVEPYDDGCCIHGLPENLTSGRTKPYRRTKVGDEEES